MTWKPEGARSGGAARERGSALLISLMVMVILTLLGIAYILLAETENQIAINEKSASQVMYVAESGARAVVEWFNNSTAGFSVPATLDIDRTQRWLDLIPVGGDGTWDTAADGSAGLERYRQTTNLLFQKPYRSGLEDTFLGSEDHPDIRITGAFCDTLTARLLGTGAGTPADPDPILEYGKVTQIDVYAPPILVVSGIRVRHGVATIKVTAQKIRNINGADRVLAERSVKAVINEINYPVAGGPLQSCSSTEWQGDFKIHWGTATVQTGADLNITGGGGAFDGKFATGMPYGNGSPTQYFATVADFNTWLGNNATETIEDPWYRVLAGDYFTNMGAACAPDPNFNSQPCGAAPTSSAFDGATDHSNLFQNQGPLAGCPTFDYALFKTVAQRGGSGIYYYAYDSASQTFKEGGLGAVTTFKAASDNKSGFFFFDTKDGNPPQYDPLTNECLAASCTPALMYTSGAAKWGSGPDSFIYLNAVSFDTGGGGNSGYTRTLNAPGEPYFDSNASGKFDTGEPFANMTYPTGGGSPETAPLPLSAGGTRDTQGPNISVDDVVLHGIMYLTGKFIPSGNGKYYGAMIAHMVDTGATVDLWYNERISTNAWPPPSSPVPKVYVSVWEVDNL